jgi:hypothetical protein
VTYVGQAGRDLLRNTGYFLPTNFSSFFYLNNEWDFQIIKPCAISKRR